MKETETLSYTLLCQLYDEVYKLEKITLQECNDCFSDDKTKFKMACAVLGRTSTIKYLIEDKLFTLWKEINEE